MHLTIHNKIRFMIQNIRKTIHNSILDSITMFYFYRNLYFMSLQLSTSMTFQINSLLKVPLFLQVHKNHHNLLGPLINKKHKIGSMLPNQSSSSSPSLPPTRTTAPNNEDPG